MNQSPAATKPARKAAAAAVVTHADGLCQPCKRRKRAPKYFPWCDSAFRCTVCEGGLGKDGRGFTRARNVPCESPDEHLTLRTPPLGDYWDISDVIHWDTVQARQLDNGTQPRPNMVKAAGHWCRQCDPSRIHDNGRYPNRPATPPHPLVYHYGQGLDDRYALSDRLLRMSAEAPRERETTAQIPFCDGLYRCLHGCVPHGQPRPLTRSQCKHVDELPRGSHGMFIHIASRRQDLVQLLVKFSKQHHAAYRKLLGCPCGMCSKTPRSEPDMAIFPDSLLRTCTDGLTMTHVCLILRRLAQNITREDVLHVTTTFGLPKTGWHASVAHLMTAEVDQGASGAVDS